MLQSSCLLRSWLNWTIKWTWSSSVSRESSTTSTCNSTCWLTVSMRWSLKQKANLYRTSKCWRKLLDFEFSRKTLRLSDKWAPRLKSLVTHPKLWTTHGACLKISSTRTSYCLPTNIIQRSNLTLANTMNSSMAHSWPMLTPQILNKFKKLSAHLKLKVSIVSIMEQHSSYACSDRSFIILMQLTTRFSTKTI